MTLLELASFIGITNILTFGGGLTMVPILQQELVVNRGVLSQDQLLYIYTVARITPGQVNLYIPAIGQILHGFGGATVVLLALILPSFLMIPMLNMYHKLEHHVSVGNFTKGLTSAAIGVIFAAVMQISQVSLITPIAITVFFIILLLKLVFKVPTIASFIIASSVGIFLKALGFA